MADKSAPEKLARLKQEETTLKQEIDDLDETIAPLQAKKEKLHEHEKEIADVEGRVVVMRDEVAEKREIVDVLEAEVIQHEQRIIQPSEEQQEDVPVPEPRPDSYRFYDFYTDMLAKVDEGSQPYKLLIKPSYTETGTPPEWEVSRENQVTLESGKVDIDGIRAVVDQVINNLDARHGYIDEVHGIVDIFDFPASLSKYPIYFQPPVFFDPETMVWVAEYFQKHNNEGFQNILNEWKSVVKWATDEGIALPTAPQSVFTEDGSRNMAMLEAEGPRMLEISDQYMKASWEQVR